MKKNILIILVVSLIFSVCSVAFAASPDFSNQQVRYSNVSDRTNRVYTTLSSDSNKKVYSNRGWTATLYSISNVSNAGCALTVVNHAGPGGKTMEGAFYDMAYPIWYKTSGTKYGTYRNGNASGLVEGGGSPCWAGARIDNVLPLSHSMAISGRFNTDT